MTISQADRWQRQGARYVCGRAGRTRSRALILAGACLISGCATNGGKLAINSDGPADVSPKEGPAKEFADLQRTARATGKPEDAKSMYEAGYALIYFNCNQYFDSAGRNQTALSVARDAVGAASAVSTSILVLTKAPKSALAAVGIGTGAALTGIDIYTKDYLFSAENVDAVRTLVTGALDTHHRAVLASFGGSPTQFDYNAAVIQLRDEQTICTLRHISALATDAIRNGHLVATTNTIDADVAGLARIQDQAVLSALGIVLQTSSPLTAGEAGALWEVVIDRTTDPARLKTLETMLSNIPSATSPFDPASPGTGTLRADWSQGASVLRTLQGFSDATRAAFEATIIASRTKQAKVQAAATSPLLTKIFGPSVVVPAMAFTTGSGQTAAATGRIDVRAR